MDKISSIYLNIKLNLKKIFFFQKSLKISKKYNKKNNFILFSIIVILLQKQLISSKYIEIRVNKEGRNQILSDEYNGEYPSVSGNRLETKFYDFPSKDYPIKFEWNDKFYNFSYMFNNLKSITYIKINNMLHGTINLSNMLRNCINLETFSFELENKGDHNIGNMENMFYNCYSLKSFSFNKLNLDYYSYDIYENGNGTYRYIYHYYYISMSHMFYNCTNLETIENSISYNIQYVSNMSYMFFNCTSLQNNINLVNFTIDYAQNINLSYMFYNCQKLVTVNFKKSYFHLSDMKYMFYNCSKLNHIYNLDHFSSSNNLNMSYLFFNCQSLESIAFQNNHFHINDAREMFYNNSRLTTLTFYPYLTISPINMSRMFYNCNNLQSIIINNGHSYFYPNDISSMFYNCTSLVTLSINKFNATMIEKLSYLFYNCKRIVNLNLFPIYFPNEEIIDMKGIFQNCESLVTLNLALFYTPNEEII